MRRSVFILVFAVLVTSTGCSRPPSPNTAPVNTSSAPIIRSVPKGTPNLKHGENLTYEELTEISNRVEAETQRRRLSQRDGLILLQKETEKAAIAKAKRIGAVEWPSPFSK